MSWLYKLGLNTVNIKKNHRVWEILFFWLILFVFMSCCSSSTIEQEEPDYSYTVPEVIDDGWEVGSLDSVGIDMVGVVEIVRDIFAGEYPVIHSLLMVRGGRLVLEVYAPGFTRSGKHEVQSVSKSFRSALIGIAIDKGFISGVNQRLFSFFPDYAYLNDPLKNSIRLSHVLTMSSGFDWNETELPFEHPDNKLRQMYEESSDWVHFVLSQPMSDEPGAVFNYNTGTSILQTDIITYTTGIRADRFADDYLYIPMQMQEHAGNWPPLSDGMRSRDMAKLGYLFLNQGLWKGNRIISESWINESVRERMATNMTSIGWLNGYGYQWWTGDDVINGKTIHMYAASGNGGQVIAVFPELDLVVVFTGGCFDDPARPFRIMRDQLIPVIVD